MHRYRMVNGHLGHHHVHVRKRIHTHHEPYPHTEPLKRFMDKAIYGATTFGIVMTIPQIMEIWVGKDASGVSALSWVSYMLVSIFWLVYGLLHKEKPIIFGNTIWLFLYVIIIWGTLLYG